MRRVFLMLHSARPRAIKAAVDFATQLQDAGIAVYALDDEHAKLVLAGAQNVLPVSGVAGSPNSYELAVVFGGDGTILRAADFCRGTSIPILGVNLGHVGFLAEAEEEDVHEVAARVIAGDLIVEERLTIDIDVWVDGELVATNWALNEAAVEKAERRRMIEVIVAIDERPVSRWGCDGVVCSTPTGSTAYNFSAGGPVVWPEVAALILVPISAHALFSRPMVVSPDSRITIEVTGENAAGVLWCDGRRASELPLGARVEVRRGHEPVRLARLHALPFADRLVRKFDLPVDGWRGAASRRQAE